MIVFSELGDRQEIAECLELLAELPSANPQLERAARLFGSAEALIESIGLTPVRAELGEAAFAPGGRRGGQPLEQAIASALARKDAAASGAAPPTGGATGEAAGWPDPV